MNKAYTKAVTEIYDKLKTNESGLSKEEAQKRLEQYGENVLTEKKKTSISKMIIEQLTDKMIIILFIASILSFILGELAEGVVILIIIVINTAISIIQEKKAADAVEALRNMNAPSATVIREGKTQTILSKEVVLGDIVYLEAGRIVPADVRLISDNGLMIDESALTGESVAVSKDASVILKDDLALGDRLNMAYSGTIITYGTGKGIVVATGMNTEVGKIANMLENTNELDTPLKRKLEVVGKTLSIVGIIVSILIFIIGFMYGKDLVSLLMISISLAISVIPEGLPATATIVMALGVQRMANKNALVKKLPAVETLGSASVICTDKTGTLTQNKMTVVDALFYDELVLGKKGEVPLNFLLGCMLCNNASLDEKGIGDPTEIALLEYVKKENIDLFNQKFNRVYEQPFDSDRKRMSVVCEVSGRKVCYTKGALEELLELCPYILKDGEVVNLTDDIKNKILAKCEELSSKAYRILGFAKKTIDFIPNEGADTENDLIFIGISCMIDPPRDEVMESIKTFKDAGIKVVMITGDHKLTAVAIAKELGIFNDGDIAMTGEELHKLSEEELISNVSKTTVFARVAPEDKLRIVGAYKANGEVVAMTGDGVNDSPALKTADIGVAMGKTGTDVAKNAADMLLLDDNFTTIEVAVREGRRVYSNIQKVIQFLLSGNIAEVLVVFFSTVFNLSVPILAVHILFINLVTDTLPALALGVDPENPDDMKKKPVKEGSLFEKGLVTRVIFYGILISIISLVAYVIGAQTSYNDGVTMAFLVLCLSQIVHALNQHSSTLSIFSKEHPNNKYLFFAMLSSFVILMLVVFIKPLASFFSLVNLSFNEWVIVALLSLVPLVTLEIYKLIRRI